ncbi:MAG: class I SAM-dependent methyltransferase [Solirubrobacteraceae bacterium]
MSAQPWGYNAAAAWYDRLAAPLWERTAGRMALQRVRHEVRAYIPHGAHVLDVGGGTGRSTQLILDEADPASVVGIDSAATMLDQARHRVRDSRARFEVGDATALDFDDHSLDAVVVLWVLETLPDPLAALRECLRVLRPDGRVIAAFSSRPRRTTAALLARPAGTVMQHLFAGRFLTERERPLHTCSMECIHRHTFGYVTVTTFGKRCQLSAVPAPR